MWKGADLFFFSATSKRKITGGTQGVRRGTSLVCPRLPRLLPFSELTDIPPPLLHFTSFIEAQACVDEPSETVVCKLICCRSSGVVLVTVPRARSRK